AEVAALHAGELAAGRWLRWRGGLGRITPELGLAIGQFWPAIVQRSARFLFSGLVAGMDGLGLDMPLDCFPYLAREARAYGRPRQQIHRARRVSQPMGRAGGSG